MDDEETGIRLFKHSPLITELVQEDTCKAAADTISARPKKKQKKTVYLGVDAEQIRKEATTFLRATPADIVVSPKDTLRYRRRIRKSRRTRRSRTIRAQQRINRAQEARG